MRAFYICHAEIMNLQGVVTAVTGCAVVVTGGAGVVTAGVVTPGGAVFAVVTTGVTAVVAGCIVAVEMNK